MKTVLVLTAGPYFWPEQETVRARYETLSKRFEGFVLSFVSRREYRHAKLGRFELVGWHLPSVVANSRWARMLVRTILTLPYGVMLNRRRRIDVVVAYDPLVTGVLGLILARLIGARLIVEVNGAYAEARNWQTTAGKLSAGGRLKLAYARRMMSAILRRADAIKLLYPKQVDQVPRLSSEVPRFVFHSYVPLRAAGAVAPREPFVLFAGHPWHRKGVDVLLRAFDRLASDFPGVTLKVAGYLPDRESVRNPFDTSQRIEFLGALPHDRCLDLMRRCAVFVLPSRSEAMGRVLLEAMACARPIVASRVDGIPTYVHDGFNGLLVEPGDAEDLEQKLRLVLSDDTLAERLACNGLEYSMRELSEEAYLERFEAMVEAATGARTASRRAGRMSVARHRASDGARGSQ